jgi:hypothetical protein
MKQGRKREKCGKGEKKRQGKADWEGCCSGTAQVLGSYLGYPMIYPAFPQFFHANDGIVPRLSHCRFLPNSFQFIVHPLPCHSTVYRY